VFTVQYEMKTKFADMQFSINSALKRFHSLAWRKGKEIIKNGWGNDPQHSPLNHASPRPTWLPDYATESLWNQTPNIPSNKPLPLQRTYSRMKHKSLVWSSQDPLPRQKIH